MKQFVLAILFLSATVANAATCTALANGDWETASNWSCGAVPGKGDIAIIPAGIVITVTAGHNEKLGGLDIYGTLLFDQGTYLNFQKNATLIIESGGTLFAATGHPIQFPATNYTAASVSQSGPYYVTNTYNGTSNPLPVELISFSASEKGNEVTLNWTTSNEVDFNYYELEYSVVGTNDWQSLANIPASTDGALNHDYSYTDNGLASPGRLYRLKMIDLDGNYTYSDILLVSSQQAGRFLIAPTVATSSLTISLPSGTTSYVSVFNSIGQLVKSTQLNGTASTLDVSQLRTGDYFLRVIQGNQTYAAKFIKQ